MPLHTLLDLPVNLASDILDPIADQDFELDLRVTAPDTTLPMMSNTNTCQFTVCDANCHSGSCACTISCNGSCGCDC